MPVATLVKGLEGAPDARGHRLACRSPLVELELPHELGEVRNVDATRRAPFQAGEHARGSCLLGVNAIAQQRVPHLCAVEVAVAVRVKGAEGSEHARWDVGGVIRRSSGRAEDTGLEILNQLIELAQLHPASHRHRSADLCEQEGKRARGRGRNPAVEGSRASHIPPVRPLIISENHALSVAIAHVKAVVPQRTAELAIVEISAAVVIERGEGEPYPVWDKI